MKETGMLKDINGENGSKFREKGESKEGGKTFLERAKKHIGAWGMAGLVKTAVDFSVAAMAVQGAFSGISRVEGVSMPEASGPALALRGSKSLTDQKPSFQVAPNQRANFIDKNRTVLDVPTPRPLTECSPLDKLWPHLAEDIDKWAREGEQTSKGLPQGEAQGVDDGKTPLEFRSRKVTPGGETARFATDAHPDQLKQDKSKGVEDLELSEEEIDSMKSFADSLKEHPKAVRGFRKLLNDEEVMKGVSNLMKDEEFKNYAFSELKKKGSVEQAISLLGSGQAASLLKGVRPEGRQLFVQNRHDRNNTGIHQMSSGKALGLALGLVLGSVGGVVVCVCCCAFCCRDHDFGPGDSASNGPKLSINTLTWGIMGRRDR